MKYAKLGEISNATLRTQDLLSAFVAELEWQQTRNGEHLANPENFQLRDRVANLLGECQDVYEEDGETLKNDEDALELVNELGDMLSEFAPPYAYFGAHEGDGACFGYWINLENTKEQVDFVSSNTSEYPEDGFVGEWLHINERGNCTLYVRNETGEDKEVWSLV